jgi:hypothetical protein
MLKKMQNNISDKNIEVSQWSLTPAIFPVLILLSP